MANCVTCKARCENAGQHRVKTDCISYTPTDEFSVRWLKSFREPINGENKDLIKVRRKKMTNENSTARLVSGRYFNIAIKLIGQAMYGLRAIKMADALPDNFYPRSFNKISQPGSKVPIYAWGDATTKTIWMFTDADRIVLHSDCSNMLKDCAELKDISALFDQSIDADYVSTTAGMFEGCIRLRHSLVPNWYRNHGKEVGNGDLASDLDRASGSYCD